MKERKWARFVLAMKDEEKVVSALNSLWIQLLSTNRRRRGQNKCMIELLDILRKSSDNEIRLAALRCIRFFSSYCGADPTRLLVDIVSSTEECVSVRIAALETLSMRWIFAKRSARKHDMVVAALAKCLMDDEKLVREQALWECRILVMNELESEIAVFTDSSIYPRSTVRCAKNTLECFAYGGYRGSRGCSNSNA